MATIQPFPFGAFVVEAVFLGRTVAFALGDGTVRLADGPAAETVRVHSGSVLAATPALDKDSLITGGDDGLVARTLSGGRVERLAERPRKWIDQVAAGPNGAVAFGTGREATVLLPGGVERHFEHERRVEGLAFAPKGLRLAVARYNGVTLRFAATDGAAVGLEWKGAHTGVSFSPDGRHLVTTMQENALHGWRLADNQHLRMSGYPGKPKSLSWSAKGRFLASSGAEMAVLWPFHFKDGPQGKEPLQLGARQALVSKVACHPNEEVVAIGYQDGAIVAARFSDAGLARLREPDGSPVSALAWHSGGLRIAFGTEAGAAGIIDLG